MEGDILLQRISSEPSEQSKSPSQTDDLGMHSPFIHVASLTPQAIDGRAVGSTTVNSNIRHYSFVISLKILFIYPCEIKDKSQQR